MSEELITNFSLIFVGDLWQFVFKNKNRHSKLNSDLTIMKFLKDMKRWKTIIQFIITVLTAIVSSFLTQSCMR